MSSHYTSSFLSKLSPQELAETQGAELADQIATYFTPNPNLKYAGVAGLGTHGGALLFRQFNETDGTSRRIIVKYSLDEEADSHLRNEHKCLQYLRGAEHIVQLISLDEAGVNVAGTGRRPTIALEFMEHGDGHRFREKLAEAGIQVTPSRILWRIFFCLVRQNVAMAYPPQGGDNARVARETMPTRGDVEDFGLTQGSPHPGNIVFGDLSDRGEHSLVPIVKLIDFGRGVIEENKDYAHFLRLFGAAYLLICCALPTIDYQVLRVHDDDRPNRWVTRSGLELETHAHKAFLTAGNIDVALKDLVALCLSPAYLPDLSYVVKTCLGGIRRKLEHFDSDGFSQADKERESDEAIKSLIQQVFLDGEVKDIPRGLSRPAVNVQMGTTLLGLFESEVKAWELYAGEGNHEPIPDVILSEDDVD
ncbi:hypothetical protein F4776DRAFT_675734 [Hypoxylon sp. NC0597]|nr:hypothetical protein F4776DRAFT_675734 [Hypoxylon sp. NC0597]